MRIKFITLLISVNLFSLSFSQNTCENNCGSGTLQEYWDGEANCVCSLDCAGYGSACCDFYEECFENPSNLEFSDFVGSWDGNITNDETWSYDDPISLTIETNGEYAVTNNPGGHLVSDLYPGTEQVSYNSSTNILSFRWVQYYHYSCGGACYSGVYFQVMEHGDGNMTLFYNNGSGPAPQARSMFLSLDGWQPDLPGDVNEDGIINITDIVIAVNIVLGMSPFNELADVNEDSIINVQDIILLVNIILWGAEPVDACEDIDGNVYETVQIGDQLWMAENLKVTHYNNGDAITYISNEEHWGSMDEGQYGVYDGGSENANIYGNLYNWGAIGDIRGICPVGWHVPSNDEFTELIEILGGESIAGGKMKEAGLEHWNYYSDQISMEATNQSGFSGLPAGHRNTNSGDYIYMGFYGYFWTSTETSSDLAWRIYLLNYSSGVGQDTFGKPNGFSIRCLSD
ncbi:MAG: FISUMP domain-containing protein [Candidatus Neomarinimicrobiota bacterium]|nr:FISUMP domain-containing protein [Candidatus Neomarinimicrobiota bacterium]